VTDPNIPDEKCNVFTWRDDLGCSHDPKVIKYNELTKYIDGEKEIIKKLRDERDSKINKHIRQSFIDKINSKVEALKPYISERSDIKKTIPKNPMCEERHYRFLKEPKGVVPTILQNLLDARKNTRKQIKENQKLIKDTDDDKEVKDLNDLNKVLDKRQLAYKIVANSMYGILGVKKGLLPFMAGAMVCTYMGRTNIEIVADTITKKYGGKLVYGDMIED
jgi:DNA polymerase elongation subunit (family B)